MGNQKELTCKTGLEKGVISKEVFEREIALCQKLCSENKGGCGWGKCKDCGLVPFLYKLYKGQLIEDPEEIKAVKEKVLELSKYGRG